MGAARGPLRICLVSEEEEGWGGIGTYTAVLARGLRDLGHSVHVVLRDWEHDRREEADGIAIHRITVPEPSWRRGTVRLGERLYSAREAWLFARRVALRVQALAAAEGIDVVEAPEHRGAGVSLALARSRPALVVRLHTPAFLTERANEQSDARLDRQAVELLERLAVRRANRLTAPSDAVARAVAERWRLPASRIAIVPNPVDEQLFSPYDHDGGEARDRGERPVVLCVARLELVKGVDVLVEALPVLLARHPGVRVVLVGEDDPMGHRGASMAAHLRERSRALGMPEEALDVCGAVPRRELPALLRSVAVCAVPSRWENLPYACIEAMACARPVVASRVGGLGEAVTDGADGLLVTPGDPPALADAICRVLEDRALAERLGTAARATVERRFAQRVVALRVADVYRQMSSLVSG
jgi:glycogen synthase